MLTLQGFSLIAELAAATLLIVALTGFIIHRSKPWLLGFVIALMILFVAVTIVVEVTTSV